MVAKFWEGFFNIFFVLSRQAVAIDKRKGKKSKGENCFQNRGATHNSSDNVDCGCFFEKGFKRYLSSLENFFGYLLPIIFAFFFFKKAYSATNS